MRVMLGTQRMKLRRTARRHPALVAGALFAAIALALLIANGPNVFGQTTVFGVVSGSYFALGAVGLTLVYGVLRLVNFAHGDFLTFGAYMAFVINVTLGLPLIVAVLFAIATTAAVGVGLELLMWRPMRAKRAGMLPLLLVSIGLAFVIRNGIEMVAGTSQRNLRVNVTSTIGFIGLRIGRTELIVVVTGVVVLTLVGLMLRYTRLGKQMRALADNFELAETTPNTVVWPNTLGPLVTSSASASAAKSALATSPGCLRAVRRSLIRRAASITRMRIASTISQYP